MSDVLESLKKEGLIRSDISCPSNLSSPHYIVYLDDESEQFQIVSDIVSSLGFTPFNTSSTAEALAFIESKQSEIVYIISDYKLKDETGFDFRVNTLKLFTEIPFSILSGNITRDLALKGIDLKITALLEKPFSREKFLSLVEKDGLNRIQIMKEERELLQGFLQEATEKLEQAEELSLTLEQNPGDIETINRFFGLVHTLKGASGYFKPKTLHQFIHKFEDVLKRLQRGEQQVDSNLLTSILSSFDFIRLLVNEFKTGIHSKYNVEDKFLSLFAPSEKAKPIETDSTNNKEAIAVAGKPQTAAIPSEIRVSIALLDEFLQTSGEMTVIRNMINKCVKTIEKQYPGNKDVGTLNELLEELHAINSGIQEQMANLRKIPVRNIIKPIPRVLRDVCKTLNKEAELEVTGDDLAVDTAIAAVLNNSLIHLVRNSLDHGLELPDVRERSGKNKKGTIKISSYQRNDNIHVSIEDDGSGINESAIRKRLVKNGTYSEAEAEALKGKSLYSKIFEAGFSTAEKVTDISGRGVGMSMVKDSVETTGGFIDIDSRLGVGSKFTLVMPIPKSVLIQNCLFVGYTTMSFGFPQDDILRVLQIASADNSLLSTCEGATTVTYENEIVPLIYIGDILSSEKKKQPINLKYPLNVVIIGKRDRKIAIIVDQILDFEDTVIKPLQHPIKSIEIYLGAAFMGDGSIGMIFSTEGILNSIGISSHNRKVNAKSENLPTTSDTANRTELLLFSLSSATVFAIPTRDIIRIEELETKNLQVSDKQFVIPYRDNIMFVIELDSFLNTHLSTNQSNKQFPDRIQTLVLRQEGITFGFVVTNILDVASHSNDLVPVLTRQKIIEGCVVLGDLTVTVLNTREIISIIKNSVFDDKSKAMQPIS